jgi:hypothetical protein
MAIAKEGDAVSLLMCLDDRSGGRIANFAVHASVCDIRPRRSSLGLPAQKVDQVGKPRCALLVSGAPQPHPALVADR